MLSKPINPNTMYQNNRKNAVIHKNSIVYNEFTISDYTNNDGLTKMKIPELKNICKNNRLHISGTKPVLIERIHTFFKKYGIAIKIQKMIRGYFVRASFKLRGDAFKNRAICTNTTDFYTMEPLDEISFSKFYSYTDAQKFTYGFDIDSLIELYNKKGRIINPYNREKISFQTMNQILQLNRLINIVFKPIVFNPDEPHVNSTTQPDTQNIIIPQLVGNQHATMNNTTYALPISTNETTGQTIVIPRMTEQQLTEIRVRPIPERVTAIFMEIDQLGHYTDVAWFNNLDKRQLYNFYREIYSIWRFRAQLPYMTKFRICPFDPVANIFPALNYEMMTVDELKEGCLQIIENMVYMGYDAEYRNLGAFHILTAFTSVSIPARTQMPWLYESIY
jgi:hypothetical protein